MTLRVWTCTTFEGHHPVGTSAVIVADDKEEARRLLNSALICAYLPPLLDKDELVELDLEKAHAVVLQDGDY